MEKTLYITAHWCKYNKEFLYAVQGYEPSSDSEYVVIEKRLVNFETPNDTELRVRIAGALKNKRSKVLADAHEEVVQIDQEIQELLALEDKSETPAKATTESDDDITF